MRAEDLLPMTSEFKKSLDLNANQQTLWQQVDSRSRAVLRERQHRREALQDEAKALLARPDVELRELNTLVKLRITGPTTRHSVAFLMVLLPCHVS